MTPTPSEPPRPSPPRPEAPPPPLPTPPDPEALAAAIEGLRAELRFQRWSQPVLSAVLTFLLLLMAQLAILLVVFTNTQSRFSR